MAIQPNANALTIEAIDEFMFVAELCINKKKKGGGIYGYPATLLLLCVIDAIGNSLLTGKEPFRVVKMAPFGCKLNDRPIKNLGNLYRNRLVHNAMIAPGTCLTPEDQGDPFTFNQDEPVLIRVKPLHRLVRSAWKQMNRAKLNPSWRTKTHPRIESPINLSTISPIVAVAASGTNYVPPPTTAKRTR